MGLVRAQKGCILSWDLLTGETFVTTLSEVATVLVISSTSAGFCSFSQLGYELHESFCVVHSSDF